MALESVCIRLGESSPINWKGIRAVTMKEDFILSIVNFNTDNITDDIRKTFAKDYLSNPEYTDDRIYRAKVVCGPRVKWAIAQLKDAQQLNRISSDLMADDMAKEDSDSEDKEAPRDKYKNEEDDDLDGDGLGYNEDGKGKAEAKGEDSDSEDSEEERGLEEAELESGGEEEIMEQDTETQDLLGKSLVTEAQELNVKTIKKVIEAKEELLSRDK